jgi:hypothetical protein
LFKLKYEIIDRNTAAATRKGICRLNNVMYRKKNVAKSEGMRVSKTLAKHKPTPQKEPTP